MIVIDRAMGRETFLGYLIFLIVQRKSFQIADENGYSGCLSSMTALAALVPSWVAPPMDPLHPKAQSPTGK